MTVIQDVGYELSPDFNVDFNRGRTIARVGFENERYDEMIAVLSSIQFAIFGIYVRNKTVNGEIVRWVDVEGYVATHRTYPDLVQAVIDASFRDPDNGVDSKPIAIDIFVVPLYPEAAIIHQNTIFPVVTTGLSEPYSLTGMVRPPVKAATMRYISINVSKESPVIDNVMHVTQIEERTAAAFYLSPYKMMNGLTVFVCGNTGQEVVDEVFSPSIANDVVPLHVVKHLLTVSTQNQYDIARLVHAHRRLYGSVSNEVFSTYVLYTYRYQPVLTLLDGVPNPTDEQLDAAFHSVLP